jgi:hypothetical protein
MYFTSLRAGPLCVIAVFGVLTVALASGIAAAQAAGAAAGSDKTRPAATMQQSPAEARASEARASAKAKGEITFDDLKFEMELGGDYDPSMLSDEIRQLDGKVVKLRGYILPSTLFRETNIDEFVLVRDNQECCFGPGAALFDCVVVNLIDGVKTDFTTRPVTVTGKFRLKEYKYPDDSGHFAIFNLQGTSVK